VRAACLDLQQAAEELAAAGAGLTAASDALRVANTEFQAGVGTPLDVVIALQNLAAADAAVMRAILRYNLALAEIDQALRTLLEPMSQTPQPNSAAVPDPTGQRTDEF
jgi:OMF family outer membrane factor